MSQVRTVRIQQPMERSSGYEHILAMQQERQRAEAAARDERLSLAAVGLVLLVIGTLAAVFSGGAFSSGRMGAMALLAVTGVTFLIVGLALVNLSAPQQAQPVTRHARRYD